MSRISPGERAAEQRALLDAAALVFDRRGFVGASVKDLADETSTTVRAIKRHFGSKEGVARAVVDEQNRRMVAALDTALLRHGPLEALIHASRAMADLLTSDPTVRAGVRLTMELAACDPAVAGQFRGWVDQVAGLFERAKEAGDVVDRLDPTELGATFVAYFTGGFVNGFTGEILQKTGSYVTVFAYFSGMYLLSLLALQLLVPRLELEKKT